MISCEHVLYRQGCHKTKGKIKRYARKGVSHSQYHLRNVFARRIAMNGGNRQITALQAGTGNHAVVRGNIPGDRFEFLEQEIAAVIIVFDVIVIFVRNRRSIHFE